MVTYIYLLSLPRMLQNMKIRETVIFAWLHQYKLRLLKYITEVGHVSISNIATFEW
jgi:hypothetical protein